VTGNSIFGPFFMQAEALFTGRDVLGRDGAAGDLVVEFELLSATGSIQPATRPN
jgi:hypothetical protein